MPRVISNTIELVFVILSGVRRNHPNVLRVYPSPRSAAAWCIDQIQQSHALSPGLPVRPIEINPINHHRVQLGDYAYGLTPIYPIVATHMFRHWLSEPEAEFERVSVVYHPQSGHVYGVSNSSRTEMTRMRQRALGSVVRHSILLFL